MKPDWQIRNPKRSFDMNPRKNMMNWVMSMCNFWIKNGLKTMYLNSQNIYLFMHVLLAFTIHSSCFMCSTVTKDNKMLHFQLSRPFQVINVRIGLYLNHFFRMGCGESCQTKCRQFIGFLF